LFRESFFSAGFLPLKIFETPLKLEITFKVKLERWEGRWGIPHTFSLEWGGVLVATFYDK
jgi:hypothetical protein